MGWQPSTIYDIGAYRGQWSKNTARIFPAAEYVLFEANGDNEVELKRTGYRYFIVALAAKDAEERTFFSPKNVIATGASIYRENTPFYKDENLVARKTVTTRLDSVVEKQKLNYANLVKINVQGAELDVLTGAEGAVKHCDVLIVETSLLNFNKGAPLFGDVIATINDLGFKCVDICEIHRIGPGLLLQIDLLFVRDPLYRQYNSAVGLL
jgi:FkbM family methyltransferase